MIRQIGWFIWPIQNFTGTVWKGSGVWVCDLVLLVIVKRGEASPRPITGTDVAPFVGIMGVPYRILTVDNEPSVAVSLKYVFARPRYEVSGAESGPAALAMLAAHSDPYDLIIVDQKMPNLTGVELVDAIRKRGIPGDIIVLSAHILPEIREAYERLNVLAIFPKPFDLEELRNAVKNLAD